MDEDYEITKETSHEDSEELIEQEESDTNQT